MKKLLVIFLALITALTIISCSDTQTETETLNNAEPEMIKIGVICSGDENESYTKSHLDGIDEMIAQLGIPQDSVMIKYSVDENSTACQDAAIELANNGCDIIFGTSSVYEKQLHEVAMEYPEVHFCHASGKQAKNAEEDNTHNYFVSVYEARYASGVVAGLKLKEMLENEEISPEQLKLGYVASFAGPEVKSGYTAFYLGAKSVLEEYNVVMDVMYVNATSDETKEKEIKEQETKERETKEKEAALKLINNGCIVLSHHTDTVHVAEVAQQRGVYFVGYNLPEAQWESDNVLASVQINWGPYYTYAVESLMNGNKISKDWCKGFSAGAVSLEALNPNTVSKETSDIVEIVISSIKSGELKVFDTSKWTVKGKSITTTVGDPLYFDRDTGENPEFIIDGAFAESTLASAPSFSYVIDGITEVR